MKQRTYTSFLSLALSAVLTCGAQAQSPVSPRGECDGHAITLTPDVATQTLPPYPAISQRLSEQGTTVLQVTINSDGTAGGSSILQSSGHPRLDAAAADWIKSYWRWDRVLGCSVSIGTVVKITWALKDQAPPAP